MNTRRAFTIMATALLSVSLLSGCAQGAPSVAVGECLASPPGEPTELPVIPCEDPHEVEVYHLLTLDGDEYPGESAVQASAESACLAAFEPYVGAAYADSRLRIRYLHPTAESWAGSDREVVCLVLSEEPVTGSLRGSGN